MDPASIFSIIAGSAGLALQCGKLIRDLHDVTDMYKNANLTIVSMITGLETIQWAWGRIQAILEISTDDQSCASQNMDADTFHQLERSLNGGRIVIAALEEDLKPLAATSLQDHGAATGHRILNRVRIVWNATALREHQERIRDQMNSMNLMISVLKLPNPMTRRESLGANMDILRKSDESACTIVPSRLSTVTPSLWSRTNDSIVSEEYESSLVYRELAIDDGLFTAKVYKRNYRVQEFPRVESEVLKAEISNKALRNLSSSAVVSSTPRMDRSHGPSTTGATEYTTNAAVESATTRISQLSITSSQPIRNEPPLAAALEKIVTGWSVLSDSSDAQCDASDRYVGIPGPTVSRTFSVQQGLSEWKTSHTEYPKLDHEYVLSINQELFVSSINIPIDWLHHCLMAACVMNRNDLIRWILVEEPALLSKSSGFYRNRRRHPVELAFQHGHIHIVKHLLSFSGSALWNCDAVGGRIMIRHAIREHDTELLSLILMQNSYSYDYSFELEKPIIRLEHRDCSELCLASIIEASAKIKPSYDPDRSALRFLAPLFPPDIVIIARLPLSKAVRRMIIKTILMQEAHVRCSHHGFLRHYYNDKAAQGIADYLMVEDGSICLGEVSVETYSRVKEILSLQFGQIARRSKVVAALQALK
ncbi:MAG: hypothetical protein Q9176_007104 [Flavoplaca citrina]